MKRGMVIALLTLVTLVMSYIIILSGSWVPLNPPWYVIAIVTALLAILLSTLTVMPYCIFTSYLQQGDTE
jgi:CHASE2 domain-containing sensor protein